MGLFSRKNKPQKKILMDLEYNKQVLSEQITALAPSMHEYREDPGSRVLCSYITKLLNMEVLNMATAKEINSEAYSYQRGRIDALKDLVERREVFIYQEENAKSKTSKEIDHKAKDRYFKKPRKASTAGLAI